MKKSYELDHEVEFQFLSENSEGPEKVSKKFYEKVNRKRPRDNLRNTCFFHEKEVLTKINT